MKQIPNPKSLRAPLIVESVPKSLICFSHLRWDFVFQRPQHLLTRASKHYAVSFVEEPMYEVVAEPYLRFKSENSVNVLVPVLPDSIRQDQVGIAAAQRSLLEPLLMREDYIAWYYTPMAITFTRHTSPALTVYDNMDELSAFRGAPPALLAHEAELLERADLVFTGGQSLFEAKKHRHPDIHAFPSSIDAAHFFAARGSKDPAPPDLAAIPRPRIGFFGVVDERMDIDLLARAAELSPDWQFIIIGPVVKIDPGTLPRRANIHWLGQKSYAELPAYLAHWDVGMMPFALNEATRFISPTKTPEFLAAGVPVVSTPVRDVVLTYGQPGLVEIAETAEQFIAATELLLKRSKQQWLARVDQQLALGSWDMTWAEMNALILSRLNNRISAALNNNTGVAAGASLGAEYV
jgi:glycosyltransferase involved in cell wall biosynthesis